MERSKKSVRCRRNCAFTLIELLAVVSIISMLISMAMTGLAKARSTARGVVCQSSVRGLAQAVNLYYNELNDLPTTDQPLINLPTSQQVIVDMLAPYHEAPAPATDHCVRPWACPNDTWRWQSTGGTYIYYPAGIYANYGIQPPHHTLRSLLNRNPRMELFMDGMLIHGGFFNASTFDGAVRTATTTIPFAI